MMSPRVGASFALVIASVVVTAGSAAKQNTGGGGAAVTPECQDQAALAGSSLTLVINVSAAYGREWIHEEGPAAVAEELLTDLNSFGQIYYSEASGVAPNVYINITLDQENNGTEQDSAWASVSGLGFSGELFNVNSGASPYTDPAQAIYAVAQQINSWFVTGWHTTAACRQSDGTIRPAST